MKMDGQNGKPVICKFCNGYYDFGSEQPVCSTCHAFVYEFCPPAMTDGLMLEEKEASNDSGNEEPERGSDLFPCSADWYDAFESMDFPAHSTGHRVDSFGVPLHHTPPPPPPPQISAPARLHSRPCPLRPIQTHDPSSSSTGTSSHFQRNPGLDTSGHSANATKSGLSFGKTASLDELPTEVLLHIFNLLDDISLWTLRQSSLRCQQVIDAEIPDQKWSEFVRLRWPLFQPHYRVSSWRLLYLNLMNSVTCRFCLERLRFPILFPVEAPNLRYRRIVHEIKNLCTDPPYGIRVLALDTETYSHCLAGIEGPPQSPYQGGLFYVHVLVPDSYPIRPPVIRFLTRILHPNISFHGDVGMDCIQHNWSLALTLEKLLISVQSLLTDPYTKVCMEPVIGALYTHDIGRFEVLAKLWTWKFACHDYLSVDFVASMELPNYVEQMRQQLSEC